MQSFFPAERDIGIVDIAVAAGIDRCTLQRLCTRERLRYDAADNIAIALGYHPCQLWPEWFPTKEIRP